MKTRMRDIDMGYEDDGVGAPVVLLHGFPHTRRLWAPQLRGLGAQCRCIAPDLRGFGQSGAVGPYSMDRYADDVAELLDAVGIDRAVVGGLSMGGYVTFAFWRRHRARVRALILADTRAGADDADGRARRQAMIDLARRGGSPAVAEAVLPGMVGKTARARDPELAQSVRAMLAAAPVAGVVGALGAMMARPDSTPTLATIDVPTLIVVGAEDALTPVAESHAMHAAIEGSRCCIIPRAGHVSNLERPAAFNHLVSEFVRELPAE